MNITYTDIPDIDILNIDGSKVELADEVIHKISPLFDEAHSSKLNQINEASEELEMKKHRVLKDKDLIERLVAQLNRQKKLKQILIKLNKLVNSGLVYDGNLKSETVVLLKILPKMSDEKLDQHYKRTVGVINKRFS